ncbi:MAG TPA: metallophosphoesterase [Candidatus Sulfotelmatobacter sp.]|nr:metallophosphoesterase [Candidatus Sulfotelmatobacter sp.]
MSLFPTTRRTFIRLAATAGAGALAIDTTLIEPNRPRIVRKDIALRRWPARLEGFTIAHLSDFHYDPYCSVHPLRAAIGMVNDLRPDLIVLTGDFVSEPFLLGDRKKAAFASQPCAELLTQMQAPHGSWAVLGNHDVLTDASRIITSLQNQGIQVLVNQSVAIERDGARFWLSGIDDALERTPDLEGTLHKIPSDDPVVLLAHEPDYADYAAHYAVDLQLSGHSHGGQIRLPLLPPLFLPPLARKYVWGLYEVGGLTLYTNPGLGTVNIPVRMNCPPEITLLTIRRVAIAAA